MTSMPSPSDMARAPRRPLTARPIPADVAAQIPTPASSSQPTERPVWALPDGAPFRARFEQAVKHSKLEYRARLVALTIATYCDYRTGTLPQTNLGVPNLSRATGLPQIVVRANLHVLQDHGWLQRRRLAGGARVELVLTLPSWVTGE